MPSTDTNICTHKPAYFRDEAKIIECGAHATSAACEEDTNCAFNYDERPDYKTESSCTHKEEFNNDRATVTCKTHKTATACEADQKCQYNHPPTLAKANTHCSDPSKLINEPFPENKITCHRMCMANPKCE